ncbi:MAG: tetratricopeptide repeat protein [bacterium]|nr:tetratricopeptide repeat protein [bacterium]
MKKVMNLKVLLVIAIIIAIIAFGGLASIVVGNAKAKADVEKQLSLGDRYLDKLDYKQAILAFEKVIETDDENAEAYRKLAKAYKEDGQLGKAIDTLLKGYNNTKEKSLKDLLEVYEALTKQDGDVAEKTNEPQKTKVPKATATPTKAPQKSENELAHAAFKKMMKDLNCEIINREYKKINEYDTEFAMKNDCLYVHNEECTLNMSMLDITKDGVDELFCAYTEPRNYMTMVMVFTYRKGRITLMGEVRTDKPIFQDTENDWYKYVEPFNKPNKGDSMLFFNGDINALFSCYYLEKSGGFPYFERSEVTETTIKAKYECMQVQGEFVERNTTDFYGIGIDMDDVGEEKYMEYKNKYFNKLGENIKFCPYNEFFDKY